MIASVILVQKPLEERLLQPCLRWIWSRRARWWMSAYELKSDIAPSRFCAKKPARKPKHVIYRTRPGAARISQSISRALGTSWGAPESGMDSGYRNAQVSSQRLIQLGPWRSRIQREPTLRGSSAIDQLLFGHGDRRPAPDAQVLKS